MDDTIWSHEEGNEYDLIEGEITEKEIDKLLYQYLGPDNQQKPPDIMFVHRKNK